MGLTTSKWRRRRHHSSSFEDITRASTSLRTRLQSLAHFSSKRISRLNFKRKDSAKSQSRAFLDLISRWSPQHVEALYNEFEASRVLYLLAEQADFARPRLPSCGEQLYASDNKDSTIFYKDASSNVHSFLVIARLSAISMPEDGKIFLDNLLPSHVKTSHVKQFIQWMYTDKCQLEPAVLEAMRMCLGARSSLSSALAALEESGAGNGDLQIVLTKEVIEDSSVPGPNDYSIRVHSSLLACRSPVLAQLLRTSDISGSGRLVLDENVVPRGFLPVLVHYLYTDVLDLSLVSSSSLLPCTSSLSEARAIVGGHSPNAPLHRAAHLVHVARFLGLDHLAQQCEDVLLLELSTSTAVALLTWSLDGGSKWIARLALSTILKDFSRFLHSHHLYELPQHVVHDLFSSHFAQATEVDMLEGLIRWGEHELLRRLELAEPNVVADTVHSVSRRGIKRCETDNRQLRDIVAPLGELVRVDFVLPPFHQSVTSAYSRGLLQRGSLRDLVVCPSTAEIDPDLHWYHSPQDAPGPRLYLPYYHAVAEAVGKMKEEKGREGESMECVPSTSTHCMVGEGVTSLVERVAVRNEMPHILSDEQFEKIRSAILTAVEEECTRHNLHTLPRRFHTRTAVQLISARVVRESGVEECSVSVSVQDESEEEEERGEGRREADTHTVLPSPSLSLYRGDPPDLLNTL